MQEISILFFGKENDPHTAKAEAFLRQISPTLYTHYGSHPLRDDIGFLKPDYIVAFLFPQILPAWLLKNARIAAINFHPGPPEYPGTGCLNFALYEGATSYGVTCHHMIDSVDAGGVIAVSRFPILESDNVATLLERTHDVMLALFYQVMGQSLVLGRVASDDFAQWSGTRRTRRTLDDMMRIEPEMSHEEVARRVRALSFGPWRPYIQLHGHIFELKPGSENHVGTSPAVLPTSRQTEPS